MKNFYFFQIQQKKQNNCQISIFGNQNHYCPVKILRRSFKWTVVLLNIKKAHYGVSLNGLQGWGYALSSSGRMGMAPRWVQT